MPNMKKILITKACGYCYYINEDGAMLTGFRPSYMDQITCWEKAEEELAPFGEEAREQVRLCLFQAVLLTAGKLALLPPASVKLEYGAYLDRCLHAAQETWRKLGREGKKAAFRRIPPEGGGFPACTGRVSETVSCLETKE